jgi:signal transduction histidine kinase
VARRFINGWVGVSLRRKGMAVVAIPIVPMILLILLLVAPPKENASTALVAHTLQVRAAISEVNLQLLDAETAVRGYALSGQESLLAPYWQAQAGLPGSLARLEQLVRDNPAQVERLRQVEALSRQRLAELDAQRTGARPLVESLGEGQETMNAIRAQLGAMQTEEVRLLAERTEKVAADERGGLLFLAILLLAAALGGVLAAVRFTTNLVRRVQRLATNADRLAAGQAVLPLPDGDDEIGRLGQRLEEAASLLAAREHDLREANAGLEQRVRARTADLQQQAATLAVQTADLAAANRALAQKNDENEMFVYSVSHDLRAPLVNLQGFSQELGLVGEDLRALLAAEGVPPSTRQQGLALVDEDMATALRFIQAGVMRLSTIIDALLRLSRAGRVEYHWQAVDLQLLVARITDSLHDTIEARGAEVVVGALPPAWGDPTALEQLFANLISNALAYLDPQRPGQIEVGCAPPTAGAGSPAACAYYVRDNGLGIPEYAQTKIFQVFQRAHPEAAKGEGIGLALVHRIVERHGGAIRVESAEGAGSTFYVQLPPPPATGGVAGDDPPAGQAEGVTGDTNRTLSQLAR